MFFLFIGRVKRFGNYLKVESCRVEEVFDEYFVVFLYCFNDLVIGFIEVVLVVVFDDDYILSV